MEKENLSRENFPANRSWGYQELAIRYFPSVKPGSASSQLSRWIQHSPLLQNRLAECGWIPRQKVLTPRQVRCLVDHLGEP